MLKAHMGVLTGGSGALGALFSECCTSGAISLRFALGHTLIFIVGKKSLPDFFFD